MEFKIFTVYTECKVFTLESVCNIGEVFTVYVVCKAFFYSFSYSNTTYTVPLKIIGTFQKMIKK